MTDMGTLIKLCGMTTEEDISLVNRLRPEYVGFVLFFPKSRRDLTLERAEELVRRLDGIKAVAVTVSPTPEQVKAINGAGFDMIQIHGELSDETYNCCELPIIRAFNDADEAELERCKSLDKIVTFLFDAAEPGSGRTFDWDKLKTLDTAGRKLFLAGGLNPDNVRRAIEAVHPDGVDVSSGIERPQGGKDAVLAEGFVRSVRNI